MLVPIILGLVVLASVVLICISGYLYFQEKQNAKIQNERLEQAINIKVQDISVPPTSGNTLDSTSQEMGIRKDWRVSDIPWLNQLLSVHLKERGKSLMFLIEQSGLRIKVGEFLLLVVFVGLMGAMLTDLFFHIPFAGFALAILPFSLLNFLKEKRITAFTNQLPQALDMLSGDLRAGLYVQAGLKHLSEEFPPPLGEEFGKVIVETNLGLSLEEALNNLSKRVNTMDAQILCTGIVINKELGGNLSELIKSIGETVRERFRLKGMIKALTAENQMSAILLLVLPIGLYILLNVLAPSTYNSFSSDPRGQMILTSCLISMSIGFLIIKKITKLEV